MLVQSTRSVGSREDLVSFWPPAPSGGAGCRIAGMASRARRIGVPQLTLIIDARCSGLGRGDMPVLSDAAHSLWSGPRSSHHVMRRSLDRFPLDDARPVWASVHPQGLPPSALAAPASLRTCYLVDPASSHMLVSKIKPCMCKYELIQTVKLRMAH